MEDPYPRVVTVLEGSQKPHGVDPDGISPLWPRGSLPDPSHPSCLAGAHYGWHFEPRKKMGGISGGCELGDVNCGKVWGRARVFLTDELLRCYHKAAGNVEVLK